MNDYGLTTEQQECIELWMSIDLTDEYYAWIETRTEPGMKVAFKDMTPEQCAEVKAALTEYLNS